MLIPAAVPFAGILVVALRILGPDPEQIGWAAFTGWLGMTYLQVGGPIEVVAFFTFVTLGALGIFRSSWYLAGAWAVHIAWDFLPRQLPELMVDVPIACIGFDGLIALYLIWCTRANRWSPFEEQI